MKFLLPYRQRTEKILKEYCSTNLKKKVIHNKITLYYAYSVYQTSNSYIQFQLLWKTKYMLYCFIVYIPLYVSASISHLQGDRKQWNITKYLVSFHTSSHMLICGCVSPNETKNNCATNGCDVFQVTILEFTWKNHQKLDMISHCPNLAWNGVPPWIYARHQTYLALVSKVRNKLYVYFLHQYNKVMASIIKLVIISKWILTCHEFHV